MINKKVVKQKNKTKVEKPIELIATRRRTANQLTTNSGPKQIKTVEKISPKKKKTRITITKNKSSNKKTVNLKQKLSPKSETNVKNLRLSAKSKDSTDSKSKKSSKIKKIKEISKKVKTKTTDKIKEVIKRSLRNNSKIITESKDTKIMKNKDNDSVINSNNNNNKSNNKNMSSKRSTNSVTNGDNQKISLRNGSQSPTKANLCSKLFPTFDCIKPSINKSLNKSQKSEVISDSKAKLRNYVKLEPISPKNDEQIDSSINSSKIKEKTKSSAVKKTTTENNCYKQKDKTVVKNVNKVKENSTKIKSKVNNKKQSKVVKKSVPKSSDKDNKQKNGPIDVIRRGHRLASLNASAKVRLLCENESDKNETIDDSFVSSKRRQALTKDKSDRKSDTKTNDKQKTERKSRKKSDDSKALVPVDSSRKQIAVRKRKLIDDTIEIIPRSCKRMASLNASAIMAASYSPERFKRSKSVESNQSNNSVEMVQTYSHTVSRFEISPSVNGINGIHVNHMNQVSQQNSVILKTQKHETIETVKQIKVSNKIKDRLLGIAKLERQERAKQKRKDSKNQNSVITDQTIGDQSLVPGGEVSGFQATKVQVTKVTHINTSQGVKCVDKDKKSGHQIDSILESDSSVVHKYQVQTKATIQMQTTFNSSDVPTIANVTTITAAQPTATTGTGPRMQIHLTEAQVIPTLNSGQPTYFNLSGPTPAVVQVHNNHYQTMGASTSSLTPMPIINLTEPYPTHYSSAFSVPHFATHSHPTQNPFNYFNAGLYQPAGPLLQAFQDPCLIHKPIPFHPPAPQMSHIHNSNQFSNSTQSGQTFATEMSGPFAAGTQFYSQLQNPLQSTMRAPQTVFFQAVPQTPNATAFTLLNPSVPYSHPTIINSDQFLANRENPILTNDTTFINPNIKINTNHSNTSSAQTLNESAGRTSKSIQCSPQSRDQLESIREKRFCDSTNNSSVRKTNNNNNNSKSCVVPTMEQLISRKSNKSEHKCEHKKKKSLLLKPNQTTDEVIIVQNNRNSSSQTVPIRHQNCQTVEKTSKNALTLSNHSNKSHSNIKTNSNNKQLKTVCLQINTSLPSVSVPSTPSPSSRQLPSVKKPNKIKRFTHGWSWEGSPQQKYVYLNNEEQSYLRKCFPAIRHNEGDVIKVRDCVLLRSGPRKTDLPFVAKIAALWESPEGEMMMSLLWYYRPEHTDLEYYSNQMCSEIFASKHRDVNSVACIDDKCYVLTYNEFCRYRRSKLAKQSLSPMSVSTLSSSTVPPLEEPYPRAERMPPIRVFPELVFCCRKVYDYRQKRILKNPI